MTTHIHPPPIHFRTRTSLTRTARTTWPPLGPPWPRGLPRRRPHPGRRAAPVHGPWSRSARCMGRSGSHPYPLQAVGQTSPCIPHDTTCMYARSTQKSEEYCALAITTSAHLVERHVRDRLLAPSSSTSAASATAGRSCGGVRALDLGRRFGTRAGHAKVLGFEDYFWGEYFPRLEISSGLQPTGHSLQPGMASN